MKKIFGGIIIVLMVVIYGCEYKTDEIFFRNVDKNVSPPDLTINLNLTSDTTYFYRNPNVVLSLKLTNKEIYDVKFFVNNVEIENVYRDQQNYSISINASGNNLMKVRAEIYTSTGTGSIADKVNAESFVIQTKEWSLIYVPEQPVLKTEIEDGRLKLSWTPIKSSVRYKYYIYSSNHSKYLIDSTYNNWYIDSSYYGGNNNIRVQYEKNDNSGYAVFGEFRYPLPTVTINNKDSFFIHWDKSKFYNSINGYRLRIGSDTFKLQPADTTFVYKKGTFGNSTGGSLDLWLKNTYYYRYSQYLYYNNFGGYYPSVFLPDYTVFSNGYFPLTGTSFYYGTRINNQFIHFKFSLNTKSDIASKGFFTNYFSVSPNNKYILFEDDSYNLELLETNGLGVLRSFPTSKIVSYPGISSIIISDIGTSVFYDNTKHTLIIYDILNDKAIAQVPVSTLISKYKISAGGKYVFEPDINTLYKVENNACSVIWSNTAISKQFKFFEFFPDNQERICVYDGSTFYIKDCADFSTVTSFSIKNVNMINVDFPNKKILTNINSVYYIYSLSNGDLLKTIPSNVYYADRARLFNDYLISDHSQLNLKYQ